MHRKNLRKKIVHKKNLRNDNAQNSPPKKIVCKIHLQKKNSAQKKFREIILHKIHPQKKSA